MKKVWQEEGMKTSHEHGKNIFHENSCFVGLKNNLFKLRVEDKSVSGTVSLRKKEWNW